MASIRLVVRKITQVNQNSGFPLQSLRREKQSFPIITTNLATYLVYPLKLQQKLQVQKQHLLSFAGRTQLISVILNQIPNYYMRVFNLPQIINNQIDRINKNFFWGHSDSNKKIHLTNWENITKSKSCGGLGLKNWGYMNASFIAKLGWDLIINKQKPWVIFFSKKYGDLNSSNHNGKSFYIY